MIDWCRVVIDSGDAAAVDFWTAAVGAERGARGVGSDALVQCRRVEGRSRVYVDFEVDDIAGESARLLDLGATPVGRTDRALTLRSPGGLLFGLVDRVPHGARPAPVGSPGRRIRVVQLCVDVPAALIDHEVDFWRATTGWRYVPRDSDLVGKLFPPAGSPIQLLLQRLGPDDPGVATRAHLDLGCDDYAWSAEQMIALGAERLWSGDGWVTLRDPAGLLFCVTENSPDAP